MFWCFKWSPGYWPRLGRELLSIFPNDKALQQAFTIDAHHGSLDIPELDKAAKLYKSNLAFGSEKFKQEAFWGAIYLHRYFKSKLKSDLDSAILHLSAHVKLNPQREKSEISRGWIEVLTKLRAEGKYKAG
ncbi:MAG TPA: hypothetical protein VJ835_10860 [Fimbriimonadaceae bacterium]|nr:hypothetical protein [Fimbriimonadaceae bacterium]